MERFSLDLPQAVKKCRECFLEVVPVCAWGVGAGGRWFVCRFMEFAIAG